MVRSDPAPVQRQEQPSPPNLVRLAPCGCGCEGGTLRARQGKTFELCLSRRSGLQELLVQVSLPSAQKHLLRVFLDHERGKGSCFVSVQRLMLATGLRSRQSVFTHVGELRRLGVVSSQAPGQEGNTHRCNVYRLHWEALLGLMPRAPRPKRQPLRSVPERSAVMPAVVEKTTRENKTEARCSEDVPCSEPSAEETLSSGNILEALAQEVPLAGEVWLDLPEENDESALVDWEEAPAALTFEEPAEERSCSESEQAPEAPLVSPPPVVVEAPQVFSPEEPAPSNEATPSAASVDCGAEPAASFQVPFVLLWKLWRAAYLETYGRAYLDSPDDRRVVAMLAAACSAAVSHRHAQEPKASPSHLAEQFLRHVFRAYLRRPGRNDFLRERGHPLGLLMADLNALGTPWGKGPPARPLAVAPPPTFLAPQENVQHIRKLLEGLKHGPTATPRPGSSRRKD